MAKLPLLRPAGLYTAPNQLSEAPPGALAEARNVIMRHAGVLERRNALNSMTSGGNNWSTNGTARTIIDWPDNATNPATDRIWVVTSANKVAYFNGTSWTEFAGTIIRPDSVWAPVRAVEARNNLYFTSTIGIYRATSYSAAFNLAGPPKPLDVAVQTEGGGAGAFVGDDNTVAYRATIFATDANGNAWESAPSGRLVYRNTSGGTVTPTLRSYLPAGLAFMGVTIKLRLYRSKVLASITGAPSDEMGLVYEETLDSTDMSTNLYVDIQDVVPDALIGPAAYFSPSQQGIERANEPPPIAWDIAYHGRRMAYANTTNKHRLVVRLLSVDSASGGMADAHRFYVARGATTETYTAETGAVGAGEFAPYTSGSAAVNVEQTAKNLCRLINAESSLVYAFYVSGGEDPPGTILLEDRGLGNSAFSVYADNGGASATAYWAPALPTSGTTISSDAERRRNRIYYSKQDIPEAVPLLQYVEAGAENDDILRIATLRDSLFVFKRRDGIFRVTGMAEGRPVVQLVDPTVRLLAPQSVAAVANELYAFTDQGVVAVSDTGVRIVSTPIDDLLLPSMIAADSSVAASHAVGHETARSYLLWINIPSSGQTVYVYNVQHDTWTTWRDAQSYCATIGKMDDKLYIGHGTSNTVRQEAKGTYTEEGAGITSAIEYLPAWGDDPEAGKHWARTTLYFDSSSSITSSTVRLYTDKTGAAPSDVTQTTSAGQVIVPVDIPTTQQRGQALSVRFTNTEEQDFAFLGVVIHEHERSERGRR